MPREYLFIHPGVSDPLKMHYRAVGHQMYFFFSYFDSPEWDITGNLQTCIVTHWWQSRPRQIGPRHLAY